MKDWTGNRKSIYTTLGASNHTEKERETNDYYATDPVAVKVLLEEGNVKLSPVVWECACGEGHLSEELKKHGYIVHSTDLIDRGYGAGGVDFLQWQGTFHGDIITNPPYSMAEQFVRHALDIIDDGRKVFMFLKIQFLEGKSRRKLFDLKELKTVYVSSSRILCAKNAQFEAVKAGGGSAVAYAWYEWEKGFNGDPVIKWIN